MTYNLSQLLTAQTSDQKLTAFISTLSGKGYSATSWQTGGVQRTLIELFATSLAEQSTLLTNITSGGYLDEAEAEWLTALASEMYQVTRAPSQSAVYAVTLTNSTGTPQTINTGALWVGTTDGRRYNNTTGGTVSANGQLPISVQAESPGARYNTGAASIIIMHTPIPGITVSNASANPSVSGADAESDASVRIRCKAKWSALGAGGNDAAYIAWATDASSSVKKVKVVTNPGSAAGTVGVYIAGETSGVDSSIVKTVYDYILARCPTCVTPVVASATTQAVPITCTAYVYPAYASAYEAAANLALDELFKAVELGSPIYNSDIVIALGSVPGTDRVTLTVPSGGSDVTPTLDTATLIKGTVTITIASP
jgi:uncharacterized phage protein gp47/JayE